MAKRNYFAQALSPESETALSEWKKAQEEFSDESRLFHRIRKMFPPRSECNGEQLVALETARLRYSIASKKYNAAQAVFNTAINPARALVTEAMEQLREFINTLDASTIPSVKEIRKEQSKKDKYADDPIVQQLLLDMQKKQLADLASKANAEGLGVEDDVIDI